MRLPKLARTRLGQAGDTIIEVMIVLAVLGLALSVAYATANRGLQQSRNAQEHSEALGILNSQVELVRSAFAKQAGGAVESQAASGPFCVAPAASGGVTIQPLANTGPNRFNDTLANDKLNNTITYPGPCFQESRYNLSIVGRGNGVYDLRVRWDGLGNLGRQQEELTYRIGNVVLSPTGGYTDPEVPPPPATSLSLSFTSSVASIPSGGSFSLDWSTVPSAGVTCFAEGNWSGNRPDHGSTDINVPASTSNPSLTYSLTCRLGTTTVSKTVTVIVTTPPQNLVPLYRLWSSIKQRHMYSTNLSERASEGYDQEPQGNVGKVDTVQGEGEIALYRLYNPSINDYYMTTSPTNAAVAAGMFGYTTQQIIGYVEPVKGNNKCPNGTQEMYGMFSSYLLDHFYTKNFNEYIDQYDHNLPLNTPGGPVFQWYNFPDGVSACTFN